MPLLPPGTGGTVIATWAFFPCFCAQPSWSLPTAFHRASAKPINPAQEQRGGYAHTGGNAHTTRLLPDTGSRHLQPRAPSHGAQRGNALGHHSALPPVVAVLAGHVRARHFAASDPPSARGSSGQKASTRGGEESWHIFEQALAAIIEGFIPFPQPTAGNTRPLPDYRRNNVRTGCHYSRESVKPEQVKRQTVLNLLPTDSLRKCFCDRLK